MSYSYLETEKIQDHCNLDTKKVVHSYLEREKSGSHLLVVRKTGSQLFATRKYYVTSI